jgi:D-amino-acid dehydrogenase
MRHEQEALEAAGFRTRLMSGDETMEFEPAFSESIRGGLFVEEDTHGNCFEYVQMMTTKLKRCGVRFLTGRSVSRIYVKGGRIHGVFIASPDEELPADVVVLAAGAGATALADPLGLRIPLQPAKGYSCTVDDFPGSPSIPILIRERRVVITPLGKQLRFAGTFELAGHDLGLSPVRYGAVVKAAREVLKTSFQMKNERSWCGLRPVLPDGLPIIDKAPGIDGLIVAVGHAMLGFTQSPITGKIVAELACGETPSVAIEPFRADRF